jgi:transposase
VKLAEGWRDVEVAQALEVGVGTVYNTRQRFLAGGVEAVLQDKRQERQRQALTGEQIAHLIAIACSSAPTGHDHWTLRLLAGKAVELGFVSSISPETIRQALKKTSSSPGSMNNGASRAWARRLSRRWKRFSISMPRRPIHKPR